MGVADKVSNEVRGWAVVAMAIVLVSLILLKFKESNVGNMTCDTGETFNVGGNTCIFNSTVNNSINDVALTTDTFVSALSEPKNWVAIVIIAIIGISLLAFFTRRGKGG